MLDVVNHHLVREGFRTCTIRGDVPVKQRAQTVDAFNSDARGPSVSLHQMCLYGVLIVGCIPNLVCSRALKVVITD